MESSHTTDSLTIPIKSKKMDTDDSEISPEINFAVSVKIAEYVPWLDNTISSEPKVDWCIESVKNQTKNERILMVDNKNMLNRTERECEICKKTFKYNRWNEHINAVHSTLSLPCNKCHKTFRSQKYLRQHQLRVHVAKNVSGDTKANLRIHLQMEHSSKGQVRTCKLCNSQLKNKIHLNAHMLKVHNDDGKKHKCDVCGKSYKSVKYLRIHKNNIHVKIDGKYYLKDHLRGCRCGCRNYFLTEDELQKHLLSNNLKKLVDLPSYNKDDIQVKLEAEQRGWDIIHID